MFTTIGKAYTALEQRERRTFITAAIVFIVAASVWGITAFYSTTVTEPVAGGDYIEAIVGQPAVLNPLLASDNDVDHDLIELLFANVLDLSERTEVSDDNTTWTITLKEDLLWDDGEPLTSDDVLFTIESIQSSHIQSPLFATWQGVIVERLGDLGIRLTLRNPYAFFLDNLKSLKIVPRHIFGAIPSENLRLSEYNLEPVGNGPYKFLQFRKRRDGFIEEYYLVENPNYALDAPLIKTMTLKFFERSSDALDAFLAREVHGIGGLSGTDVRKLKISHQLITLNMPRYYAVFFNPTIHSALKDENVRAALTHATDKDKLIERVFFGHAEKSDGPLPSFFKDYVPPEETISFNPELASTLLDEAGWTIDEEGEAQFRTRISGDTITELSFDLVVPRVPFLMQTANIIKEDWANVGVGVDLVILDPDDIFRNTIRTRNYHMILFGNVLNGNPDTFSFWHSSQRFFPGLNFSLYDNNDVDDLVEAIRQEFDDAARNELLRELQTIIRADQPALFLYVPSYLYAGPKEFGGLGADTLVTPSDRFRNAHEWYLKTARIFRGELTDSEIR